jgi:hypothetical protein
MGSKENIRSDFLFAQPSFLFGLSRFFDFSAAFDEYNVSRDEREADLQAVLSDWNATAADLYFALDVVRQDPSAGCGESEQLSLFPMSAKPETTRELQKTA